MPSRRERADADVRVRIPTLLRSYTRGAALIEFASEELNGSASVAAVLAALDARFPGLRFRIVDEQEAIRPHVKLFADGVLVRELERAPDVLKELMIVGALSGG